MQLFRYSVFGAAYVAAAFVAAACSGAGDNGDARPGAGGSSGAGATANTSQSASTSASTSASAATGEGTAAVVAGTTSASSARTGSGRRSVLFIGTSLTAGYGIDPDSSYPAVIQSKIDSAGLNYVVRNAGVSGETSAGALRRIGWLLTDPADVIVIETGANDGLRGVNPDSTRANIQRIIDAIRRRNPTARLVIAGMEAPPNFGVEYTSRFRSVFSDLAEENDAALIPFLLDGVALVPGLNQGDGIHPNEEGARAVAATAWRVLAGVLAR